METVIAVIGEGAEDYGYTTYDKENCLKWEWGPIVDLMEHCIETYDTEVRPEFRQVQKEDVKRVKLLRSDRGLHGLAIPARKFRNYCCMKKLERGVFYADADTRESSVKTTAEAQKYYQEIYSEAVTGLDTETEMRFIPMIPLKMIENWLLADEGAFIRVFGGAPRLPKKPELIWGDKHNPESGYPKCVLARAVSEASGMKRHAGRELYCELAKAIDISVLRRKCSLSFERFYQDFKVLLK